MMKLEAGGKGGLTIRPPRSYYSALALVHFQLLLLLGTHPIYCLLA